MKSANDNDQFLDVLEMHMGMIYKISHAYCKDSEDRKDLMQEISIQIWRSFHQYNAQYKLSTWLYRISLNTAISFYRKEHTRRNIISRHELAAVNPALIAINPDSHLEKDENIRLLHQFIDQFQELDRALMILYLDGNSYAEMADILGITKTNVATKVSRIKQQLKQNLPHKPQNNKIMEMEELLNAWKTYDAKLDHSLSLNRTILREMKVDKTRGSMQRALVARGVEAAIFGLLMISLWIFVINRLAHPEFVIAAGSLLVFCLIGLAGNIRQIVLISQIDYADTVVSIQRKIEQIAAHHLQLIRLTMLSLPLYTAYIIIGFELFFGVNIYAQGDYAWWIGQLVFSIALVPVALWLYRKINVKYIHIKWVKSLTASLGGHALAEALKFLKEIEKFENQ